MKIFSSLLIMSGLVTLLGLDPVSANPTGGAVTAGTASISNGPGTTTINQLSNQTVINWQSFSIGAGESTRFIQPSSQSAALNRVLGGQTSIINGTLSGNGQIFLLNGNGILVGSSGVISANGFTASTRDISDSDFLKGNLHFTGSGNGGVSNLGSVNALGGDVIFIGKTVNNGGTLSAPNGHVGMAAADDVTITQQGMEHVYVRTVDNATDASGKIGVNNTGKITAASAELKAANGNIYALATNNGGTIRATGVAKNDGRIYLVAEGNRGTTKNTGNLSARSTGGKGGSIETSGGTVVANGTVDAGSGGTWLIDPHNITIDAPTAATIVTSLNSNTSVIEDSSTGTGGAGDITVSSGVTWTSNASLTLNAYRNIIINAAINGANGTLNLNSGYTNGGAGTTTTGAAGTINVANFNFQGGAFSQNAATLPAFAATNFSITGGSFLRANGGSGVAADPYQLVDVFGLQGIGSSAAFESASWKVNAGFFSESTATWNSGAGFAPIATFSGTFNGNGQNITGLAINRPTTDNVALFSNVAAAGTVTGTILGGVNFSGQNNVGSVAGVNAGTINATSATGSVTGATGKTGAGGLVGSNSGNINNSFSNVTTKGYNSVGGLAGINTGSILASYDLGSVSSYGTVPSAGTDFGGLVGYNNGGSIVLSYADGGVSAADSNNVGGFIGENKGAVQQGYTKGTVVVGYQNVGGLIGINDAGVTATGVQVLDGGTTVSVTGTLDVGGLVGSNLGTLTDGSVVSTGVLTAKDGAVAAKYIGGFAGYNSGTLSGSFSQIQVKQATGTTDASFVGGFAGYNATGATINSAFASGAVAGATQVGGLVGGNDGSLGIQVNATGAVTGITQVGGLIGYNTGALGIQSYATGNVIGVTDVGGLIGQNSATGLTFSSIYAKGNVTGNSFVGGLVGNNTAGAFTSVTSSGMINGTGTGQINFGGLMGYNNDVITLSYSTSTVSVATATNVGGLVGNNGTAGKIKSGTVNSQSYASGNVTGATAVGGLVGHNDGTIGDATTTVEALGDYTHATGTVTGQTHVGGLVGENAGTVQQSSGLGNVLGASTSASGIGGLAGINLTGGQINTSFSTSTVYGNGSATLNAANTDAQTGGLAGANLGSIVMSYATGQVVGDNQVGGLVGINNLGAAVITTSYSTGTVGGVLNVGGLVGQNALGTVNQSYSESNVTGGTGSLHVGGLVGDNKATISETYATGTVTGANLVGGLVGFNETGASLQQSYATGATTSAGTSGGLVGNNAGTVSNSYWDENSTTQLLKGIGAGTMTGATPLTSTGATPTAFSTTSYLGFGVSAAVATGAANVVSITDGGGHLAWYQLNGSTRPYLAWEAPINNPVSGGAHLVYTAHQLQLIAVNLGSSFVLGQSIDLSETQQASGLWNVATGFAPIGNLVKPFSGSFSGSTFGVSGLNINEATTSQVGLFGASSGSIGSVNVSGTVTGLNDVGLLLGLNTGTGTVNNVTVNGMVTGTSHVGGLVGENDNTVQTAAVNVIVSGNNNVGGLTGYNTGMVSDAYSLGNVTASGTNPTDLGGLLGYNGGALTIAYSTGTVAGGTTSSNVGGLVGDNEKTITQSYATGATTGGTSVGGLAGVVGNGASAIETYATGNATGTANVGGLIGSLNAGGAANSSYASGAVSGPVATTGGLIGNVAATATYANLFWDHVLATVTKAIGTDASGGGAITDLHGTVIATANDQTTYKGFDYTPQVGFAPGYEGSARIFSSSDTNWRIQIGNEFPLLTKLSTQVSGTSYTDAAHTMKAVGVTDTLNSGSNLLNTTTTDANANYDFLFAADDGLFNYIPYTGKTLRVSDATDKADSIAAAIFNPAGVPSLLADTAPADTWGNTVRVVSNGLSNTLLAQAGSSFISVPSANGNGGTNILISENFEVAPGLSGGLSTNGNITADGNVAFDSAGVVPSGYNAGVTLQAAASPGNPTPSFTLNAGLSSNAYGRAIIVESDGTFVNNDGANAIGTPNGNYIVYSQNPQSSGQSYQDSTGGINQYHLYGTDYMQTPAYLLNPTLNYQVYTFTPTLTLTAVATGASPTTGTLSVQYGTATPALTYYVSGLLTGDTVTAGQTMNQVLSNQPAELTTYAKYSNVGDYPVQFIPSTEPTSLIGYKLVFAAGDITVTPNTNPVTINVSGSQHFGYIGGGATYAKTVTGSVAGDPNFNPTFSTTVGQYTDVDRDGMGNVIAYNGTISLVAASLSNYQNVTVTTVDNGYTVLPAALTVTAAGTSIYGNTVVTPTLTGNDGTTMGTAYIYAGVPLGTSGNGGSVSLVSTGYGFTTPSVTSTSDVGSYTIPVTYAAGPNAAALSNYTVTTAGTYKVTQRPVTINATVATSDYYDGTPQQITFTSADYSVNTGTVTSGVGLINGDTITGLMGRVNNTVGNAGTYLYNQNTLAVQNSDMSAIANYALTYNNQGLGYTIKPEPLTIQALISNTKTYGNTDPTYTLGNGYYSLESGTIATGESFTTTGAIARASGENVTTGTPYLFNSVGTVGLQKGAVNTTSNYAITLDNAGGFGQYITPRSVTVAPLANATKVYGSADPTFTYGVIAGSIAPFDSLTGTLARPTGENVNGGTPYVFTQGTVDPVRTAGGASTLSNYNFTFTNLQPYGLTITPASLIITANDVTRQYDGTAHPGDVNGVTYNSFQFTDNASSLGGALTYSGASQTAINVGSNYAITPGGYTSGNYAISYVSGKEQITPAPLVVTANNAGKIYGATDPTLSYTPSGTLYGADQNYADFISGVMLNTTTGAAATAGTHPIVASGGTAQSNYSLSYVSGLLTVTKADLNVTANDYTKTYNGMAFTGDPSGITYGPFKYTDTSAVVTGTPTYGGNSQNSTNAGTYAINVTGGLSAANYNFIFNPGTLLVNKASLTVSADPQSKTYGATDPMLTYTPSGMLYGTDTYGVITGVGLTTATGAAATAGTHPITFTMGGGGTSMNYNIVDVANTLTVNKAALTVTADNQSKTYGNPDPTLTYTVGGTLFYGDPSSVVSGVSLSTATGSAATAGTHVITAMGGTASNYNITDANGNLLVNKANLIVTADPQTKIYGDTFTFTGTEFTSSGLAYADSVTHIGLTSGATPATAALGTYAINYTPGSAVGTGLANYNLAYVPNNFVVAPGIAGAPSIPGTLRYQFDQFSHIIYDLNIYGDRHYYELEVPGTITREVPHDLQGIGTGSSMIHTTIGMETSYKVDRFQTYRH